MRGWVWFNGPHSRRLQRIKPVFVGAVQMESFVGWGSPVWPSRWRLDMRLAWEMRREVCLHPHPNSCVFKHLAPKLAGCLQQ